MSTQHIMTASKYSRRKQDGGWAWLILLSSFMTILLWEGNIKSFAVLLPTLRQQFSTKTWMIGCMIALMNGIKDFSGPLVGACTDLVDTRYLGVLGGLLSGFGIIAASFTNNITSLVFCVSIMNGIGVGLLLIPSLSLLARYFDELYPFASGVAYAGISLGIILFSPLMQLLLDTYGWRSAVFLLGAINCHAIVAGTLLRPFHVLDRDSIEDTEPACTPSKETDSLCCWQIGKSPPSIWQKIMKLSGLSLSKDVSFMAAIFMMSCDSFSNTGWIVYFVPHCIVKGLTPYEAALASTLVGIANLVGRFIYIPFVSRNIISIRWALYLSGIVTAIALMVDPWVNTLTTILIAHMFYCLASGILKPLCDVHIKSIVGEHLLSQAFGIRMALNGVFRISAGFLVGWLYEQTGSYDYGYLMLGVVHAVGILVFAMEGIYSQKHC